MCLRKAVPPDILIQYASILTFGTAADLGEVGGLTTGLGESDPCWGVKD